MNELQVQNSTGSDEEVDALPSSKTAWVCKLAQSETRGNDTLKNV
jgi:hypothetical protein